MTYQLQHRDGSGLGRANWQRRILWSKCTVNTSEGCYENIMSDIQTIVSWVFFQNPRRLLCNNPLFLFKILTTNKNWAHRQQMALIFVYLHTFHNGQVPRQLFLPQVKTLIHSKINSKYATCKLFRDWVFSVERLTFTYITLQSQKEGTTRTAVVSLQVKEHADMTTPIPSHMCIYKSK